MQPSPACNRRGLGEFGNFGFLGDLTPMSTTKLGCNTQFFFSVNFLMVCKTSVTKKV